MLKLLEGLEYDVSGSNRKENVCANNLDYILSALYMAISIYNAVVGVYSLDFIQEASDGKIHFNAVSVNTLCLIIVNMLLLIRLLVKLYIDGKEAEMKVTKKLKAGKGDSISIIKIITIDNRINRIKIWLGIDITLVVMNAIFNRNNIESSIFIAVIIPVLVTFFNDWVEIAKRKYQIEENYTYKEKDLGVI